MAKNRQNRLITFVIFLLTIFHVAGQVTVISTVVDIPLSFQLNKKIEIAASLTNILNTKSYNYTTYSQLSSFESQRQLRVRQLLLSLTIRK